MKMVKLDRVAIKKKNLNLKHTHHTHKSQNFPLIIHDYTITYTLTRFITLLNPITQNTYTITANDVGPTPTRQWRPPHKS